MSYQSYRPGGDGAPPPRAPRSFSSYERDPAPTKPITIEKARESIADGRCPWCKYCQKPKGKIWGHLYWILTGDTVEDAGRRVHHLATVYKLLIENERTRDDNRYRGDRDYEVKDATRMDIDIDHTTNYVHSGTQTIENEQTSALTTTVEPPKDCRASDNLQEITESIQRIRDKLPVLKTLDPRYSSTTQVVNSSTFCELVLRFTEYSKAEPPSENEKDMLLVTEGLDSRVIKAAWDEYEIFGHFGRNDRWREALALHHGGLREACQFISEETERIVMRIPGGTTKEIMPDRTARSDDGLTVEDTTAAKLSPLTLRRQSLKKADKFLSNLEIPANNIDAAISQPSPALSPKSKTTLSIHTKRTESISSASGGPRSAGPSILSPKRQAGSPKDYFEVPPVPKKRRVSADNDSGCEPDADQNKARSRSIAVPEKKSDDDSDVPLMMRRTVSMGAVATKPKPPDGTAKWRAVGTSTTYQRGVARKPGQSKAGHEKS